MAARRQKNLRISALALEQLESFLARVRWARIHDSDVIEAALIGFLEMPFDQQRLLLQRAKTYELERDSPPAARTTTAAADQALREIADQGKPVTRKRGKAG